MRLLQIEWPTRLDLDPGLLELPQIDDTWTMGSWAWDAFGWCLGLGGPWPKGHLFLYFKK